MREAVRLLFDAADGEAELLQCSTCDRPDTYCPVCPIDDQPRLLPLASMYLRLYGQVKRYGMMPAAGGLDDQDDLTMRWLDLVDDEAAKREKRKTQEQGGSG